MLAGIRTRSSCQDIGEAYPGDDLGTAYIAFEPRHAERLVEALRPAFGSLWQRELGDPRSWRWEPVGVPDVGFAASFPTADIDELTRRLEAIA